MAIEQVFALHLRLNVEIVSVSRKHQHRHQSRYKLEAKIDCLLTFPQLTGGGRRLGSCYSNQGGINAQSNQFGGHSGFGPPFGPGLGIAVGVCCSSKLWNKVCTHSANQSGKQPLTIPL